MAKNRKKPPSESRKGWKVRARTQTQIPSQENNHAPDSYRK